MIISGACAVLHSLTWAPSHMPDCGASTDTTLHLVAERMVVDGLLNHGPQSIKSNFRAFAKFINDKTEALVAVYLRQLN